MGPAAEALAGGVADMVAPEKDGEKQPRTRRTARVTIADYSGIKWCLPRSDAAKKVMPVSDVTQISAGDTEFSV
ncbi:MAG: hypothetical protein R2861_07095 [Desulfobacterales bacterium]